VARRVPPPRPKRAAVGRFDNETGTWLVPISDAWLDLISKDWSPPVQLKAETDDGGDTYRIKVRPMPDGER
jgi:hypothetical protein